MSRASNSLKATDVTATPIKLKYSASYSNSTICDTGIYAKSGINGPVTITGSVPGATLRYRSIRQLFYSNYLTGSYQYATSSFDNFLQSTAASGTLEGDTIASASADVRYFPTESGAKIKIINIPRSSFGEKISRRSFFLSDSTGLVYRLVDDGNGNIVDELNGNNYVGNIIYAQGFAIITNPDYYCVMDGGPQTFPKSYIFDITQSVKSFAPISGAVPDCAPIDSSSLVLYDDPLFEFPSSSINSLGVVTLSSLDPCTTRVGTYKATYEVSSTYCAASDQQPITVELVDCKIQTVTATAMSCSVIGLSLTAMSPTPTPSPGPTCPPTSTPQRTMPPTPTASPTPTPSPTPSPTNTPSPTASPTNTPSPTATLPPATPAPTSTPIPTPTYTPNPTTGPSPTPVSTNILIWIGYSEYDACNAPTFVTVPVLIYGSDLSNATEMLDLPSYVTSDFTGPGQVFWAVDKVGATFYVREFTYAGGGAAYPDAPANICTGPGPTPTPTPSLTPPPSFNVNIYAYSSTPYNATTNNNQLIYEYVSQPTVTIPTSAGIQKTQSGSPLVSVSLTAGDSLNLGVFARVLDGICEYKSVAANVFAEGAYSFTRFSDATGAIATYGGVNGEGCIAGGTGAGEMVGINVSTVQSIDVYLIFGTTSCAFSGVNPLPCLSSGG